MVQMAKYKKQSEIRSFMRIFREAETYGEFKDKKKYWGVNLDLDSIE